MTVETPEKIISGTTRARHRLSSLIRDASRGTPVTIVAPGGVAVTIISREQWLELRKRVETAEETVAMLADPESIRKLRESLQDMKAGRGVSSDEAARLLGLDE